MIVWVRESMAMFQGVWCVMVCERESMAVFHGRWRAVV